jgi:hypothetical protein
VIKRKITDDEKNMAVELYHKGLTYAKIASLIKRTPGSVSNVLRKQIPKQISFPQITKNPNNPKSWGRGFWDDNVILKHSKKR